MNKATCECDHVDVGVRCMSAGVRVSVCVPVCTHVPPPSEGHKCAQSEDASQFLLN